MRDRVEPQAHGIFSLSENQDIGDAGHALQTVANVDVQIVAHEERGVATVGREDSGAEDEVLRSLRDRNTDLLDRSGKSSGTVLTRFSISTVARSGSRLRSKVAVIVLIRRWYWRR